MIETGEQTRQAVSPPWKLYSTGRNKEQVKRQMNKITANCDKCSIRNEGLRRKSTRGILGGAIQRTLIAGGDQI